MSCDRRTYLPTPNLLSPSLPSIPTNPEDWDGMRRLLEEIKNQLEGAPTNATPPGVIQNLIATPKSGGILLTWDKLPGVPHYTVSRGVSNNFSQARTLTIIASDTQAGSMFFDPCGQEAAGTRIFYWVQGWGAGGPSPLAITFADMIDCAGGSCSSDSFGSSDCSSGDCDFMYTHYAASFLDTEGNALDKIRAEWLACRSAAGDSLSEAVSDTIQINGGGGAQGLNVWTPRLISGVNNVEQFAEMKYDASSSGTRGGLTVLFSGDTVTPAVAYQAYIWEVAPETPAMRIMKMTSATANTTLDTIAQTAVAGSTYRLEASFSGADVNLRVLEDGVEILSATDVGGIQNGVPGFQRRILGASPVLFRFSHFRCGILSLA